MPFDLDPAGRREVEAVEAARQGALAGAVGPDQRHVFARGQIEADIAENTRGAGALEAQSVYPEHGAGRFASVVGTRIL